ncbi:D-alanine--D-alanine ligase [Microbacterium sp. LTA6]|uniref:D-alanine--D-alanine ligase family protein n=1 Tax=Microbacterium sp. LTA6 TaxID=3129771 RepID=UPI003245E2F4
MSTNVLVIGGGQNAEHEVSLASAAAVGSALRSGGFAVTAVTIARDGTWIQEGVALGAGAAGSLAAAVALIDRVDVVFPAVHGALGEDGALAALCALAHTPVVGSGSGAGAIGMDKWVTKLVADAVGIRTAPGIAISVDEIDDLEFDEDVVVKPVSAGSSYGVTLVRDAAQLRSALRTAAEYDRRILVERVMRGREIDVAVMRDADGTVWAPPPLEIHAEGLFDTAAKYDGSARFTVPAELSDVDRRALTEAALTMFDALGCAGVARMDFFLTEDGPVLNEVNTMPGMTAASQVPRMFQAAGVAYPELVARLVHSAVVPALTPVVR